MRAKILRSTPPSGECEEVIFELETPGRGSGWNYVLFATTDYDEWVGVFRDGGLSNIKAATLSNGTACIVSGGHGYIIDIESKRKIKDLGTERIIEVVSDNQTNSFLISTWHKLVQASKELKEVELKIPIRVDSVHFEGQAE